ncbi:MAG: hypothetical protein WCW04_02355 [Candidatus Paceibacterota bacterium]
MNDNLSKLFKQAYNHPETGLSDAIWRGIQLRQAKRLKIQSISYGIVGVLSLGGFVFMSFHIKQQFNSSGFFQYASLVFSDAGLFATYWKEYLLSLADSLPVASLGALSFLLFSMLVSLRKAFHQYRSNLLINWNI